MSIRGSYVTREYASIIPAVPTRFFIVRGHVEHSEWQRGCRPSNCRVRSPDLTNEIDSAEFVIPSYEKFTGSAGKLTGRVYVSRDRTLNYCFVEDDQGRVMLAGVEMADAPVSILGLRTQYVDVNGMDTPLLEYGDQIPRAIRRQARKTDINLHGIGCVSCPSSSTTTVKQIANCRQPWF